MHLGIDIGGTTIKGGILSKDNVLLNKISIKTKYLSSAYEIVSQIIDFISSYLDDYSNIQTIGVGVPGVVDSKGNVIIAPNLNNWINIPLGKIICEKFNLPIALDNDANCGSYAELLAGNGFSFDDFFYVTLGTGVGGCIIYNRNLLRGSIGGAGEFGHIIIDASLNDNANFQTGTLESFIGSTAIVSMACQYLKNYDNSMLRNLDIITVKGISESADLGDELSIYVMKKAGEYLGIGLASIMNIMDIPIAIVGGGISKATEIFFDSCRKTISNRSLPSISTRAKLIRAKYENDAGIIGAALLGMNCPTDCKL